MTVLVIGARYCNSTLGTFISVDPVLDTKNPNQWNPYTYANNNPTTHSDPTGLLIDYDANPKNRAIAVQEAKDNAKLTSQKNKQAAAGKIAASTAGQAAGIAYNLLDTWGQSDDARTLSRVGREATTSMNQMIPAAINYSKGGWAKNGAMIWLALLAFSGGYQGGEATSAMEKIGTNFQTGGIWDAKVSLRSQFGISDDNPPTQWLAMGDGHEMFYDVFGNAIYGAMMSGFGITQSNAIAASRAGTEEAGSPDIEDDVAIKLGYQLRAEYPNGLTQADFITFMFSSETLMALESQDRVRGVD
jgi:hypothetical protein